MSAEIWNGPGWREELIAMKRNEAERKRLLASQEKRAKAFAGNFNDLHIRSNKGKRLL